MATNEISQALNTGKRFPPPAPPLYWVDEARTTAIIDSPGFQEFGLYHCRHATGSLHARHRRTGGPIASSTTAPICMSLAAPSVARPRSKRRDSPHSSVPTTGIYGELFPMN